MRRQSLNGSLIYAQNCKLIKYLHKSCPYSEYFTKNIFTKFAYSLAHMFTLFLNCTNVASTSDIYIIMISSRKKRTQDG